MDEDEPFILKERLKDAENKLENLRESYNILHNRYGKMAQSYEDMISNCHKIIKMSNWQIFKQWFFELFNINKGKH